MLGGLIAKPQRGAEIRLLAASGGEVPQQVNQWQIVTMVATDPRGWVDVYGRTFAFPQAVRDRCEGNADRLCSAIKLLHTLGVIYRDRRLEGGYQSIALYEEFPADKEERLDARGRPKGPTDQGSRWRSQGHVGSIAEYGAHSCPACEARIPLFLCDRPID
jgi:hypothetical protein